VALALAVAVAVRTLFRPSANKNKMKTSVPGRNFISLWFLDENSPISIHYI
jgi:hypothetical protein